MNIITLGGKSITASEYYYDCPFDYWDNMLYKDAIISRRDKAFELYIRLTESQLLPEPKILAPEDEIRAFKVEKAYKDCQQLCDERGLIL